MGAEDRFSAVIASANGGTGALLDRLRGIVGRRHLLTDDRGTRRFREGFRFGSGAVLAVVQPGSLVEQWRVLGACVEAGVIVIAQAANTGLTGGSTPEGSYDRPVVIVSTRRLAGVHVIREGGQVVCLGACFAIGYVSNSSGNRRD